MLKNLITLIIILFYQISSANEEGLIINVVDGDTVHLLNDNQEKLKVRLHHIDAHHFIKCVGH